MDIDISEAKKASCRKVLLLLKAIRSEKVGSEKDPKDQAVPKSRPKKGIGKVSTTIPSRLHSGPIS